MGDGMSRGRIGRLIAEGLSVAAGVLLAFSVDAWWARVQEREVVDGLREAAALEASTNRETLVLYREAGTRSLNAAGELIRLIGPRPEPVAVDSVLFLMGTLLSYDAAPLELSAMDRLLSSGDVEALLDPEFHRGLLGLRATATRYASQGDRFDLIHEELVVEFGRNAPMAILSATRGVHPPSDFPVDVTALLSSRTLEGAVGNLAVWVDNLNRRVDRLIALSDSVWVETL